MKNNNLPLFEKKLGLKFKDKNIFKQALVHRSYLNEHPEFNLNHNERLEFLGDAVIELIVTKFLYYNFNNSEGELTSFRSSLVNTKTLAKIAKKINLDEYLFLSKGESKSLGRAREAILANTFEALIGSIYFDQGFKKAEEFIKKNLIPELKNILRNKTYKDPKSEFQEFIQNKLKITPHYKIIKQSGPDHAKIFVVGLFLNEKLITQGKGKNKHDAEIQAAEKALNKKSF
jgi:ribonuclease-3